MGSPAARWRRTAAVLAVLLAAAAACDSPSPPAATPAPSPPAAATPAPSPTAAATPAPSPTAAATPTPSPTAAATPAPGARSGLALIEPAPGVFEHRTFEDGEAIDWAHGIFVLDAETGRTDGYAVAELESSEHYYRRHRGGWIEADDESFDAEWRLLLDRETGQSWRWPLPDSRAVKTSEGWQSVEQRPALMLMATSEEHLLFKEVNPDLLTDRYILADRRMEEMARFSFSDGIRTAMFSPDGHTIVINDSTNRFYLVPVESAQPAVLFDPPMYHDGDEDLRLIWSEVGGDGQGIVAVAWYGQAPNGDYRHREERYFSWNGAALPDPMSCPGTLSPDGRYAAVLDGDPYYVHYVGYASLENPWPSVVITDAETCAPIFRVRSAHTHERIWSAEWLSTSDGFVVGVQGGYAILRVGTEPSLTPLPADWPGPDAAPTGGDRYFGYGSRVYDAAEGRWRGLFDTGGPFWWGDSHRERWFHSSIYWGEGWISWLLLPPKIEFPPFADEIAFRVARTGSCLRLREKPDEVGRVLGCLPDGERLLLAERSVLPSTPSGSSFTVSMESWVYVRTAGGAEGWVSHGYLDHD